MTLSRIRLIEPFHLYNTTSLFMLLCNVLYGVCGYYKAHLWKKKIITYSIIITILNFSYSKMNPSYTVAIHPIESEYILFFQLEWYSIYTFLRINHISRYISYSSISFTSKFCNTSNLKVPWMRNVIVILLRLKMMLNHWFQLRTGLTLNWRQIHCWQRPSRIECDFHVA